MTYTIYNYLFLRCQCKSLIKKVEIAYNYNMSNMLNIVEYNILYIFPSIISANIPNEWKRVLRNSLICKIYLFYKSILLLR